VLNNRLDPRRKGNGVYAWVDSKGKWSSGFVDVVSQLHNANNAPLQVGAAQSLAQSVLAKCRGQEADAQQLPVKQTVKQIKQTQQNNN